MDKPVEEMDIVCAEEAVQQPSACDEMRMKTMTFEEVFWQQMFAKGIIKRYCKTRRAQHSNVIALHTATLKD